MGRRTSKERLEELYGSVEKHPGKRPGFFARLLGRPRSSITRTLPVLEEQGFLLSEDDNGGLWPFQG